MELSDFTDVLDTSGIQWKERGKSLVIKDCPVCGSTSWKVNLRIERDSEDEPFLGRCYSGKCQTNFSSLKYLLSVGIDRNVALAVHGKSVDAAVQSLSLSNEEVFKRGKVPDQPLKNISTPEMVQEVSEFLDIGSWPDHPASQYAYSRGVRPQFHDRIKIDPSSNAVVFLIAENDLIVGYQKRFVNPINKNMKTKTSAGFSKTAGLLHFPGRGKIAVCEGPFTAMSAAAYGYYGICTFGSGVSNQQMDMIFKLSDDLKKDICVAVDSDDAGEKCYSVIRTAYFWHCQKVPTRLVGSVGDDLNDTLMLNGDIKEIKDDWGGPAIPSIKTMGFI